jgi:hypothetical protein
MKIVGGFGGGAVAEEFPSPCDRASIRWSHMYLYVLGWRILVIFRSELQCLIEVEKNAINYQQEVVKYFSRSQLWSDQPQSVNFYNRTTSGQTHQGDEPPVTIELNMYSTY